MADIEQLILSNLIYNEDYGRKTAPFLKSEYFTELANRVIFELASSYLQKYNLFPTSEALSIELGKSTGLNEDAFKSTQRVLRSLQSDPETSLEYLIDTTETWCQDRALYLAIMQSISIMDNSKNGSKGAIPQLLTDALAVSFDSHIGHDFLEDADERYNFYHVKEKRIPFNLEFFNKITTGGLPNKTLMILLAGVNVGKSAFMCDMAACHLDRGYKVLYITLEMAEVRIAERIEANLMDIPLDDLRLLPKDTFDTLIGKIKGRTKGKLIIKEYPTTMANVGHFRHLLNELKIKKNFSPDIVYIDYINICASSRFTQGSNVNSYTYIKSIAEELRGLAVEQNVPIVSATQLTRQGFTSTDVDMEDTAESFGLPATCDYMFALTRTDELIALNQMLVKQLKNRYGDKNRYRRFIIGVDQAKMRYYDLQESAQTITDDGPINNDRKQKKNVGKKMRQLADFKDFT